MTPDPLVRPPIRPAWALLLALPAGALASGDVRTQHRVGETYSTSVELNLATETVEFEFLRDGEPQEGPGMGLSPSHQQLAYTCVDRLLAAQDGQPLALERRYGDLSLVSRFVRRDEEQSLEASSPFEGVVLELSRSEDGGVAALVREGQAPAPERLAGFQLARCLDGLLEDAAAAPGSSWELSAEQIRPLLQDSEQRRLFEFPVAPAGEGGGRGGRGGRGREGRSPIFAEADWTGTATWGQASATFEGAELAVIELELEASGDLPEGGGFGGGGPRGGRALEAAGRLDTNTYDYRLEGRLLYSLEERRPVALQLAGDLGTYSERSMEREDASIEMRIRRVTQLELEIQIAAERDADNQKGNDQ